MDDVEFLEELAKLEHQPASTRKPLAAELGLAPDMPHEQDAWPTRPTFDEPDPPLAAETSAGRIALGVAGFLLMMCVGAAGAALLFHDRLAQILPHH